MKQDGYNAYGEDPTDAFDRWDAKQSKREREDEMEDGPEYVPECER